MITVIFWTIRDIIGLSIIGLFIVVAILVFAYYYIKHLIDKIKKWFRK